MPDGSPDDLFVEALQQMGAVSFEQLEAAHNEQALQAGQGHVLPMADLLIRRGVITPLLRENVEKRLRVQQEGGLRQLGPYRLVKKLGEGGMGAVFLAEDTHVGRPCAIKVLPRECSSKPEFLTRFRREAVATGKLNHPNIVMAYTVGEELGVHFYAMEYCSGEPLDAVLKRTRIIPWTIAVDVMTQVANGLQHAHEHGIIHRDIKPANIFICRPPTSTNDVPNDIFAEGFVAKILDLGLSKTIDGGAESSYLTQTGLTLGTPHYISPEQANGEKEIDGRTDIYSLGATFYHLVTGQTPFSGSTAAAVIMKHMREQLRNPRDLNPVLPEGLCLVIQRMMAKDATDRYTTCEELLDDLDLIRAGQLPASQGSSAMRSVVAGPLPVTVAMPKTPAPVVPAATVKLVPPGTPTSHPAMAVDQSSLAGRPWRVGRIAVAAVLGIVLLFRLFGMGRPPDTLQARRATELQVQQEREKAQASVAEAERARRMAELRAKETEREADVKRRAVEAAQGAKLGELEQQLIRERLQAEQAKRQLEEAKRQVAEAKLKTGHEENQPNPAKQSDTDKAGPIPDPSVTVRMEGNAQEDQTKFNNTVLTALERWATSILQRPRAFEPPELPKVASVDDVDGLKRLQMLITHQAMDAQDAERRALESETALKTRIGAIQRRLNTPERPSTFLEIRPPPGQPMSRPFWPPPDGRLFRNREADQQQLSALNTQATEARSEAERMGQAFKTISTVKNVVTLRLRSLGVQTPPSVTVTPRKENPFKVYVLKDGTEVKASMAMKMGEQIAIKDEKGEMRTIQASDVREIRNEP